MVKGKDVFVVTSNVDTQFEKNGFDTAQIWTPQGDFRNLQCAKPCRPDAVWNGMPTFEAIKAAVDPRTQLTSTDSIPACPHCGGEAMYNLRGGPWFLETRYKAAEAAFEAWLDGIVAKITAAQAAGTDPPRVGVLDLGTGFNTPSGALPGCETCEWYPAVHALTALNTLSSLPQWYVSALNALRRSWTSFLGLFE